MNRRERRARFSYAIRGVAAIVIIVGAATAMVLRGSGNLERSTDVVVAVPASAGLINGEAPVRYHGVNIGRVGDIESDTTESVVHLQIKAGEAPKVPADVIARVVPRTFFGDIYLQLVDNPQASPTGTATLADGGEVNMDTGPEAVALYDIYVKVMNVLTAMHPEKVHTALTALAQALDGNGTKIGATIDSLSSASRTLTPSLQQLLDSTPEFASVLRAVDGATPDVLRTLSSATALSDTMIADHTNLEQTLGAAALFATSVDDVVGQNTGNIITLVDSGGKILATTAANPEGLYSTLANASTFGEAGARVFSTGKFNITAVPTFADPMPYTGADCPRYGPLRGSQCSGTNKNPAPTAVTTPPPTVGGPDEGAALRYLEDQLLGTASDPAASPNAATTLMLGPLVRGSEVTVP